MSASQRRKGAAGEREAARELATALNIETPKRHLGQARDAGADLERSNLGRLVVEVKRRRGIAVHEWMAQCVTAASDGSGNIPVVLMRGDEKEWLLVVRLEDLPRFAGEIQYLRKENATE